MAVQFDNTPKPAIYNETKSATWLITPFAAIGLLSSFIITVLIIFAVYASAYLVYAAVVGTIFGLILALLARRVWWMWRNSFHRLDPDDGRFLTVSNMKLSLLLTGSLDDVVKLDNAKNIDTPGSKFVSKYLHSDTLTIDGRTFTHIKNVKLILEIVEYRESLASRAQARADQQVELLREVITVLEDIRERLTSPGAAQAIWAPEANS